MDVLHLIAGHGAGDCGAVGNGYQEAERVRALAAEIKARGGDQVVLHDTSVNYYATRGIANLSIPKGDWLVELHMDSASDASAHGGHVIIKRGIGGADRYDKALAERVSAIFPGRSQSIVEHSELRNPNIAAQRGINYRLVENGFITNAEDVSIFNSRLGELADAYLAAFGLTSAGGVSEATPAEPGAEPAKPGQPQAAPTLLLDCDAGTKTFAEWARQLGLTGSDADGYLSRQYSGNRKYLKNVSAAQYNWYKGCAGSPTVRAIQSRIGSANVDGVWGAVDTENLRSYMKSQWGYRMTSDGHGVFGANTAYNVQHSLNAGLWAKQS